MDQGSHHQDPLTNWVLSKFSNNNIVRKHVVNPKHPILEIGKTGILYKYKCQDFVHVYLGKLKEQNKLE